MKIKTKNQKELNVAKSLTDDILKSIYFIHVKILLLPKTDMTSFLYDVIIYYLAVTKHDIRLEQRSHNALN